MKTFYTLHSHRICLWIGVIFLLLPGVKTVSQTKNDTIPKTTQPHIHKDGSSNQEHDQERGNIPFYTTNLSDSLNSDNDLITEIEITKEGDTILHYRYKAFDLGDTRYEGPSFLSDAGKELKRATDPVKELKQETLAKVMSVNQNNSVGKIDFTEGLTPSGGKTYSIPILTAPVASSAPQIALTYNSQAVNGVAGYGWNISGLSAIAVAGRSIYYDDVTAPLDLSKPEECTFYLDGTRLVSNTGSLSEYHYETAQGFILVKKHMSGSNIAYFTVAFPDGRMATYGFTGNTSMKHVYPLTEMKDLKGYMIHYEYTEAGNNYYVSNIKYGGKTATTHLAELRFNYVSRTDYAPVYMSGIGVSSNRLLKSIASFNSLNATSEVRAYTLTHALNYVQQLTQIDCTTGSLSLNPLQFTYEYYYPGSQGGLTKETSLFLSSYFASGSEAQPVYVRGKFVKNRFNDGLITFPGKFSPYGKTGEKVKTVLGIVVGRYAIFGSLYPHDQTILIAPGLSFYSQTKTITTEEGFQTISAADVNGDGVDEIVKVNFDGISSDKNKTILKITKYSLADGSTLSSQTFNVQVTGVVNNSGETYSPISRSYYFGDFSGTGKIQLLTVSHNKNFLGEDRTSNFALINLETGTLISESTLFSHSTTDQAYVYPLDVNGDGKTELCFSSTSGWKVYTLSGTSFLTLSFTSSLTRSELYRTELIGDMNGDGMADMLIPPVNSYQDWSYAQIPVWAPHRCYNCGTVHPLLNDYSPNCRSCNYDLSSSISLYNLSCNECSSTLYSCNNSYSTPMSVDDACCPTHGRSVYKEVDLGYVDNGNSWTVYLSTGKGHIKSTQSVINSESGEIYYLMDVNGDGKSDLLRLKNSRVKVFLNNHGVIQSTATGNEIPVDSKSKILPANVIEYRSASHFITIEDAYVNCYRFTKDESKDKLLTKLTDSYGMLYENDYLAMTDNVNYFATSTNRYYPYATIIAPLNLLHSSHIFIDHYTPLKEYNYTWHGAVIHKTGLGFSGFEKVRTIEYVQNITVEEERNPLMFGVTTKTDSPFKTAYYYYARNEGSNKKCNPRMTSVSETDKLTGVYSSASYVYDTYNNATKVTTNAGSGSTSITRVADQTYDNIVTSSRYLIGQPLIKTVTNTRGGAS